MRDIERRMARLESTAGAPPDTVDAWIIDGSTATNMATGERVAWGDLDRRPAAPHAFSVAVHVVEASADLEERP